MNETTDASAIFAPIWRRKWLILAVGIIVAAGSYLYYKRQRPTYQATTQVFLGASEEGQVPGERTSTKARGPLSEDQAAVINTIVVEQVRHRLRAEHKGALARGARVKARAKEKSEFITITSEAHSSKGAALLANLTAQAYIKRRTDASRRAVERALAISRRQLRQIQAAELAKAETPTKKKSGSGSAGSSGATAPSTSSVLREANLSSKINQLESSLGTIPAQQVKPATAASAQLLSPKPRRDAIFGFVIGLVLAAIAAYAFSRFDSRLRSIAAIEAETGFPLLAAMPKVRRPIVRGTAQPPRPSMRLLEPLRRLESALRLPGSGASSERSLPRVSLFVSPDPGDGKSTIVAGLALALRDAGERVVIVEANFRRPVQSRLLGVGEDGRLAAVLTGRLDVEEAAQRVMPALAAEFPHQDAAGNGIATAVQADVGSLFLVGGDRSVANPPALLGQESAVDLLDSLAERFDYVLIDAPSPLEVSDVMPLLGVVGRIVVVARADNSREASARRLRELLERPSCAPVTGVVANCVAQGELKRYGFSSLDRSIRPVGRPSGR
jgi:non-specific protein-tyrosine kinase